MYSVRMKVTVEIVKVREEIIPNPCLKWRSFRAPEFVPARVCQVKLNLNLNLKSICKKAGKQGSGF